MPRGGKRIGAGRKKKEIPPEDVRKLRSIRVTDAQWEKMLKALEESKKAPE